ncbi:MAG: AMP-binding protein [Burkholderiaceae bacterium]|nr:AMP-binding protein [Burkholderiaceae bacterium]
MTVFQTWAARQPDAPALIAAETGEILRFGALNQQVQATARALVSLGLAPGDGIALLMENRFELIVLGLAARQAGLYFTPISTHLAAPEVAYILKDSGARAVFVSRACAALLPEPADRQGVPCFAVDEGVAETVAGCSPWQQALARAAASGPAHLDWDQRPLGRDLLYSSGTTGRPKGVRRTLTPATERHQLEAEVQAWQKMYFFDEHSVYLSPAPLYHAAPLRFVLRTLEVGGHAVIMAKFAPEAALALMARHRVTHSQWVPTMFTRLLQLPLEVRQRYDLRALRMAVHAAAPCPVPIKQAMLDWWGDVLYEYYAGSESVGTTFITSQEWRKHPGSVGRVLSGQLHIVGDDGQELPPGEVGRIYFSGGQSFEYLNDSGKTRDAYNDKGWATYGDIGHVDAEGYLYLSDRRADLILAGGVNVYPQEIENVLNTHPAVADAAVVGVPDADFGEVPKAVVCLRPGHAPDQALADAIGRFSSERLARLKLPRTIVFAEQLPRLETGKLLRRVLKDQFKNDPDSGFRVQR